MLPYLDSSLQKKFKIALNFRRGLILFFMLGYLFTGIYQIQMPFSINFIVVALVMFLGAIFVCMSVELKIRLLQEMGGTVRKLLPICASCKKIRKKHTPAESEESWESIEEHLSNVEKVNLTHGLCPECYTHQIKELEGLGPLKKRFPWAK